ncbi:MAG: lipid-A-disaccharide synthase [Gammaproteobacteria bacterium]|nr:lipid-A-disaccharide synthase [Gammaproteobacteria bacterium]
MSKPLRIGIVAGETSGDLLAANLMRALRVLHPEISFVGIAGPRMLEQGCQGLYPLERLAVMGLTEVLGRYPELLRARNRLARQLIADPPDIFIGVDAPDFNLGLESRLKRAGITTVHYVSPSVWAWRRYRLHKIARSVDLMLTLFPFEEAFYQGYNIPVRFVGHPLADMIDLLPDRHAARRTLNLSPDARVVALLPGSRSSEVRALTDDFIRTALWCCRQRPDVEFIVPLISGSHRDYFSQRLSVLAPQLPVRLFIGQSHEAMCAADAVLLACGTAALEAMLLKRPMVVAYRVSTLTYAIARRLVKVRHFSLPNLLSAQTLVPEYIQDRIRPETMGEMLIQFLDEPEVVGQMQQEFTRLHHLLRQDAGNSAARAILELAATPP